MFRLTVEDVFVIRNRGVVATGRVESGTLRVGDAVQIDGSLEARVDGIEVFRKSIDEAKAGDNIGVLFKGIENLVFRFALIATGDLGIGCAYVARMTDEPLGRRVKINEDWLAVIVGLALLALVLVGAIPGSVIP
jgi:translation elongation factor EF-1alpha